ncbi:FAD-dependent oxidoreductase [Pseudoxanthomonas daejeonensis]|uniref:L-aspartate oxidase n=1 Tax=Pseudoxanthomonas daejeonensis TaxID=266062 RepID=A0ABQ6Z3T8_9GAMM|nr:FAD-binding protein [Pseudoxanthomonas daejeonensis]KAF1692083.1 L-aspartate oxidase [Pseudoxanthomonas daejeonensis]UNK58350.1 FAD-dependent oxidoreductase [Pseudoxanthomonas daejeonensis]
MSARPHPLVVVGGGVAGLSVALAAAPRPVLVIARGTHGQGSASALAQGGIAAALAVGDTPAAHARDTLEAGAGHNDTAVVEYLVEHAPAAIGRLQALGVPFDCDDHARLRLGREGGHRADRIVHAGGDASGAVLLAAMLRSARAAGHIELREGVEVQALLLRDGGIAGLRVRDAHNVTTLVGASEVVLATGGIGALFSASTNPSSADGNGLALGLAAGAAGRDLEFVQFHPTALAVPGDAAGGEPLPLVTEALRGAGARLYDARGRLLMAGLHPLADLAPRDLVARRVWQALREDGQAWLDATALGDAWPTRFPTVHASCRANGIDPARERIPVTPAAHFHMGGLATDHDGRTGVRGLYAVGEVACNGVHGANRLASNSLLEGLVFGDRLGRRLADIDTLAQPARGRYAWSGHGAAADPQALAHVRQLLWSALGPVRNGSDMAAAQHALAADAPACGWQGRLARQLLAAASRRAASLGAHYRSDDA